MTRYGAPARGALVTLDYKCGYPLSTGYQWRFGIFISNGNCSSFWTGTVCARSIIVTWTDGEKLTKVLDSEKDANQLIVIRHPDTTSSFNSWSAERNGEKNKRNS